MTPLLLLCADTDSLGRATKDLLSIQNLMELLVEHLDDNDVFKDSLNETFPDWVDWPGVLCDDGSYRMEWGRETTMDEDEPDGVLESGGSIDLGWIPPNFHLIRICGLSLYGTIDTSSLSEDLVVLQASRNNFDGSFDVSGLPNGMQEVGLDDNQLSGTLTLEKLPPALRYFEVGLNNFTGTVSLDSLPKTLECLDLRHNAFHGTVDVRNIPLELEYVHLQGNNFQQDTLVIPSSHKRRTIELDTGKIGRVADASGMEVKTWINGDESTMAFKHRYRNW